jgi:hypothetical protein
MIAHLFPSEQKKDLEAMILKNLRDFESSINIKTKKPVSVVPDANSTPSLTNEVVFDTYLQGMSQKQINFNLQSLPRTHRILAKYLTSLEQVREEIGNSQASGDVFDKH